MVNSFTWNNYEEHCEQCVWCFLGVCSCWKPNGFKVPGLISITSCMVGHLPPPNDLLLFLCWIQAGPMLALCSGPECIFFGWATKAGQHIAVLQEKIHYLYMASCEFGSFWEAKHPFSLFQVEVVWTKGLLCSWSAGMFAHYGSVMCSVAIKTWLPGFLHFLVDDVIWKPHTEEAYCPLELEAGYAFGSWVFSQRLHEGKNWVSNCKCFGSKQFAAVQMSVWLKLGSDSHAQLR